MEHLGFTISTYLKKYKSDPVSQDTINGSMIHPSGSPPDFLPNTQITSCALPMHKRNHPRIYIFNGTELAKKQILRWIIINQWM